MKYLSLQTLAIFAVLVFLSIFGALTSAKIREGILPIWWQYVFTIGLALTWSYIVKYSEWSLLFGSAFYDIVVSSTWLIVFAVLGDPATMKQKVGFVLTLVGLILIA
jgi:hypothetical protein